MLCLTAVNTGILKINDFISGNLLLSNTRLVYIMIEKDCGRSVVLTCSTALNLSTFLSLSILCTDWLTERYLHKYVTWVWTGNLNIHILAETAGWELLIAEQDRWLRVERESQSKNSHNLMKLKTRSICRHVIF